MNETSETKPVKRSGAFPFFHWLFSWRMVRRALIGLIGLATLIGLLITEENWRGKRAWDNYRHEWEAKGEKFDWQSFVPPAVPDDENFFTAPGFTNLTNDKRAMLFYGNDGGPDLSSSKVLSIDETGSMGGGGRPYTPDLKAWQIYYRDHPGYGFSVVPQPQTPAKDVLFALGKFDSAVEELRQASQRPYAQIPLNYEEGIESAAGLLPYLAELKRCIQLLQLRAIAELADGENDKAVNDIKLMLYLGNSLRSSPFLISHLVRIAIVSYELQPIWEGLAKHEWSDAQLVALDTELVKQDFLADFEFVMSGERALAIASLEHQQRTRELILYNETGNRITNSLALMPNAYFYQNELNYARVSQQWILPLVDINSRIVSPEASRRAATAVHAELKHYSLYKVQSLMIFPALASVVEKFADIQTSIDLARTACALERYRLAHNEYPEKLDVLTPQFMAQIPHDVINGQPLHYRRETDGRFVLYSVGWNEKDDGGKTALTKNGVVDWRNGDWVWQYPAK